MQEIEQGCTSRPAKVIEAAIRDQRLAHALLLYGEDVTELQQVAENLAGQILGCSHNVKNHPDLFTLSPSGKARIIKIGDSSSPEPNTARSFIKDIQLSPRQGTQKVAILSEVDRLKKESANALLKTIEEPPDNTTLFLLTNRPYDILTTIRSRCFTFKIPTKPNLIDLPEWKDWINDYQNWLQDLISGKMSKQKSTNLLMAVYGLATRFSHILDQLHEEDWESKKGDLHESLSPEQIEAMVAGHLRSIRKQMLVEVEIGTRDAALRPEAIKDKPESLKLAQVIEIMEYCVGLMEVNFKAEAAIEYFLLSSLRIWSRK